MTAKSRTIGIGGGPVELIGIGRVVARPIFVPSDQALLLALPHFCLQIDFSST